MIPHLLSAGIGFILGAGVMLALWGASKAEAEAIYESDFQKRLRWERARYGAPSGEDEEHG